MISWSLNCFPSPLAQALLDTGRSPKSVGHPSLTFSRSCGNQWVKTTVLNQALFQGFLGNFSGKSFVYRGQQSWRNRCPMSAKLRTLLRVCDFQIKVLVNKCGTLRLRSLQPKVISVSLCGQMVSAVGPSHNCAL